MANRSTFGSILPRDVKRFIDLSPGDAHYIGELRRMFIDAHKHHKKWHAESLTKKQNVDIPSGSVETAEEVSST